MIRKGDVDSCHAVSDCEMRCAVAARMHQEPLPELAAPSGRAGLCSMVSRAHCGESPAVTGKAGDFSDAQEASWKEV